MPVERRQQVNHDGGRRVHGDKAGEKKPVGNAGNAGNAGNVGNAKNAGNVDDAGKAHAVGGADVVDKTPGTAAPLKAQNITGPFAALAKRGDFSGYVLTKSGQELFVSVRISKKDPGGEKPLVYLDGLAARRERAEMMADKFRDEGDRTVISILLPGQGETLLRDLQKTKGKSIDHDLKDRDQANAVIEALDALGVDKPVDIFGLSYGGAIAAATARDHADRIDTALLVAPHTQSEARDQMGELSWQMVANNPWNPMGTSWYRSAAKSTLSKMFGEREMFKDFPGAFGEALFRLSMGIDTNQLASTTRGIKNLQILVAEGDGASPAKYDEAAVKAAKHGKLTMAPDALKGQHDLVSANPEYVVLWVTQMLNPERAEEVDKVVTASMKKRMGMEQAQGALAMGIQLIANAPKGKPEELFLNIGKGMAMLAAAAELGAKAVPDAGKPGVDVANNANDLAHKALDMVKTMLKDAPADAAKPMLEMFEKTAAQAAEHAAAAKKALDG